MAAIELENTPLRNDANLVWYGRFENNVNDSKGSNHLTAVNTPTYETGKFNNAIKFAKASNQYAWKSSYVPLSGTGNFSISLWVKFTSFATGDHSMVCSGAGSSNATPIFFQNDSIAVSKVFFELGSATGRVINGTTLSTGVWYHFVVVYNGSTIKIYLNGSEDGSVNYSSANLEAGSFVVGENVWDKSSAPFDGVIDDLAIFSRALTATEISNLYNGTFVTTQTATITAKARIKTADVSKSVQAKARVKVGGIIQTVQTKARIKQGGITQTISAKAYILGVNTKLISAKARLFQPGIVKTLSAKARIKYVDLAKTVTAKARIRVAGIVKTISAKAHIHAPRRGFILMKNQDQTYKKSMADNRIR